MKSAPLLGLTVCLAASALPASAQEAARSSSPDRRRATSLSASAIDDLTRQAMRLAAAIGDSSRSQPRDTSEGSQWARVRRVTSGTEVVVAVGTPGTIDATDLILRRYFLSADDSGITLLNLTRPALPATVARSLREIAARHPGFLEGAARGGVYVIGSVRLTSAGVFMADRQIADLGDVVETRTRKEVVAIQTRQRGRGVWGHLGPLGGYFVGAMSGGYLAGLACQATVGRDRCDTGAFLTGALAGGLSGIGYGIHAARRETDEVIYAAGQPAAPGRLERTN
jgi:hypothetical protein